MFPLDQIYQFLCSPVFTYVMRDSSHTFQNRRREELQSYDLSALKSLYSHIYRVYRGKKGETEFGYSETWNSTTATLVLLHAWSKAPIHGTDILCPHPMEEARKSMSCTRTHHTQRGGLTRTRYPEFLSPRLYQ